jgi:hypothetical protein
MDPPTAGHGRGEELIGVGNAHVGVPEERLVVKVEQRHTLAGVVVADALAIVLLDPLGEC